MGARQISPTDPVSVVACFVATDSIQYRVAVRHNTTDTGSVGEFYLRNCCRVNTLSWPTEVLKMRTMSDRLADNLQRV